jgi:cytoskeletal protein RodZ
MSLTLGEKLRQAREERGISISEVAEQTRISALYLGCIENDDYRTLPGGIFNKGFVKSFAKCVGVDEQEALQDYARIVANQDNQIVDEPKTYRPQVLTDEGNATSNLPTIIFAVLILGLMTWGVLALVSYIQNQPSQTSNSNVLANTATNINAVNSAVENINVSMPAPATDKIEAEIKALRQNLWVQYKTDDKTVAKVIKADAPLNVEAQKSLTLSYAKAQTKNIQLTLNGKQIELPSDSAAKGNNISFEISKENIQGILQNGRITTQ